MAGDFQNLTKKVWTVTLPLPNFGPKRAKKVWILANLIHSIFGGPTEGCKEASKATPTVADEAFSLLSMKSGLALQPIKATKASPNAVVDKHLSWEQITTARHTLIATANRVRWAPKLTLALVQLYIGLEGLRAEGKCTRALILYHVVARKLWHNALQGHGDPFNISLINGKLLDQLENQVRDSNNDDMKRVAMDTQRQMLDLQRQASKNFLSSIEMNLKTNLSSLLHLSPQNLYSLLPAMLILMLHPSH